MSNVTPFSGRHPAVPEFLKRDTAGARRRLSELMGRQEWLEFALRSEFERAVREALGPDIEMPPPDAA